MDRSFAKTGFFIGLINFIHVVFVFMNRHIIILPKEDKNILIFAWFIFTVILAVTGLFLSKKGYNEEKNNMGLGIAGIALNSLVILPVVLFILLALFAPNAGGVSRKRSK